MLVSYLLFFKWKIKRINNYRFIFTVLFDRIFLGCQYNSDRDSLSLSLALSLKQLLYV